ncbi:serine carboxypeptidase S28 [Oesophagostomum dentatum]|uniref:Serine carboxypeptidase S28 n=1 Tax=Oesophagostomum dentatum TaxID=61180 RepID=A0A0B1TJ16_OESDE|nr:serine carboxypeptidase S28 [Oesophagostomum dentatum]
MVTAAWQPRFHLGRPMFGFVDGPEHLQMLLMEKETGKPLINNVPVNTCSNGPGQAFFIQKLDHFDKTMNKTWPQVSDEQYPFVTWGKKFGAALFALEHRFYGESHPTPDQSVENLKYLSSRQALEDVANFIRSMNAKYGFKDPLWVTFGGSYSGALSLWARQAYPDLIIGAIGSSAPVNAVVDFWGYLEVVEEALIISHSFACADNVRKGFREMSDLMQTEDGRAELSKVFKCIIFVVSCSRQLRKSCPKAFHFETFLRSFLFCKVST